MTFDDAIVEAFDQGWYVHSLGFEPKAEGFPADRWYCTLRATSGPSRREISRGYGATPCEAVCNALIAAPEPEPEIVISLTKPAEGEGFGFDLAAAMRRKFGPPPLKRRI